MDTLRFVEFRILGPLEVSSDRAEVLTLGGAKQRSVLAALCIHSNQWVSRDRLVDMVWGEVPPPTAIGTLQAYVSRLRRKIGGERIVSRGPGYLLRLGPDELDAETAERLFEDGRRAVKSNMPVEALRRFRQALGLWRGPPLADFFYEDFAQAEVARLEELRLSIVENRLAAELAMGRHTEVIGELERLVLDHPLRERLWGQLMLALYRADRQAEALRTYQRARRLLGEELGIEPSQDLQHLEEQILCQDSSIALATPPGGATPAPVTLTFLSFELANSALLSSRLEPEAYEALELDYRDLLERVIDAAGGEVVDRDGDGILCAFGTASGALDVAVSVIVATQKHSWLGDVEVLTQVGLHTGEALNDGEGGYVSVESHRAVRLAQAAWGDQVLVSEDTWQLAREERGDDLDFAELGPQRLKDSPGPLLLFQLLHPLLPSDFPPPRTAVESLGNLPVQLTSFVGRQAEVAAIRELLDEHQLVTIAGPGGVGKTRLSVEVAETTRRQYPDGVWFVDVAALAEPGLVMPAFAGALGVDQTGSERLAEAVLEFLRGKRSLVVADNCEHLLESVAAAVQLVLQECPMVDVVSTSREPLAIPGERVYRLHGLGVPDPLLPAAELRDAEAVRLLEERARVVRPAFTVTDENASAVVAICRVLDGIPLALELVAARFHLMSPEEAISQLDDQLAFLSAERRGVPDRHKTLRATIDWSYRLLDEPSRDLLCRLAVFRKGFDLDSVAAVLSDPQGQENPVEVIARLIEKSLIFTQFTDRRTRYHLPESVRTYALEEVITAGREQQLRESHARFFLRLAEQADPFLTGPDQSHWIRHLDDERENLRAAWDWFTTQEQWSEALQLATKLGWFHLIRGYLAEGRQWLEHALAHSPEGPPDVRAEALLVAGVLAGQQGDTSPALRHFRDALRIRRRLGDRGKEAALLVNMGVAAEQTSDFASQRRWLEEALSLLRTFDDPSEEDRGRHAAVLNALTALELTFGNATRARELATEALSVGRSDAYMRCRSLDGIAMAAAFQGRFDEGGRVVQEAISLANELGDRPVLAGLLLTKGQILSAEAKRQQAAHAFEQAVTLAREVGDTYTLALTLQAAGQTAALSGDRAASLRLLCEGMELIRDRGWQLLDAGYMEAAAILMADQDPSYATPLFEAAETLRASLEVPDPPLHRGDIMRSRQKCHDAIGKESLDGSLPRAATFETAADVLPDLLGQLASIGATDEDERPT